MKWILPKGLKSSIFWNEFYLFKDLKSPHILKLFYFYKGLKSPHILKLSQFKIPTHSWNEFSLSNWFSTTSSLLESKFLGSKFQIWSVWGEPEMFL